MTTANALDTTIAVVTPENIAFEYQLAGPFRRLPAYLIDVATRWAVILLIGFTLLLLGAFTNVMSLGSFLLATGFVVYFVISWFYGTFLETYFNGRTIGKWACGLRVICVDGRPIDGTQAVIRNLVRVADIAPFAALSQFVDEASTLLWVPTGMVGFISVICTRRMQRLGDLAAGTMVVVDEKSWRLPVTKVEDPRVAALASYIPGDYRVTRSMARTLAVYCERRAYLTPARRREIAMHLTTPLIERFEFRPDIDPDLLMVAMYYATFLSDSRSEPVSLGALAGASPLLRDQNRRVLPNDAATSVPVIATAPLPATVLGELEEPAASGLNGAASEQDSQP
ncbi:MAG: RDD family protein [Planctomycetaceae bacterium]